MMADGGAAEPRRAFTEKHAKEVENPDVRGGCGGAWVAECPDQLLRSCVNPYLP